MTNRENKDNIHKNDKINRDEIIDIIKAVGIILMVMGHSGSPVTHFIYLFHMAIFFIAAGYCYKEGNSNSITSVINFIKRKIRTLYFPYVLCGTIFSVLHNFFIRVNVYTNNPLILEYVSGKYVGNMSYRTLNDVLRSILRVLTLRETTQIGGALWFVAALFELSIVYCVIDFFIRNIALKCNVEFIQGVIAAVFLVLGYYCSEKGYLLGVVNRVLSCYILFYCGHILKRKDVLVKERKQYTHLILLLVTLIILLVLNQKGSIDLGNIQYENPIYLMLTSVVGWQFLYELSYYIKQTNYLRKIMVYIGQNTMSVVIFHFLSFKIVNLIGALINGFPLCTIATFPILLKNGLWWIAYTVVGVSISLCLGVFWKKTVLSLFKDIRTMLR